MAHKDPKKTKPRLVPFFGGEAIHKPIKLKSRIRAGSKAETKLKTR